MKLEFIFILFSTQLLLYSQNKYKIIDSESQASIANVELRGKEITFFTNDDGDITIPTTFKDSLLVYHPLYKQKIIIVNKALSNLITLTPIEKTIPEVIIDGLSANKIFKDILKNYTKIYYDSPSEYDCLIKQKAFSDGKLNNLLISQMKIWTLFNGFDFSKSKTPDSFLQISLNSILYYKTKNQDIQINPSDFIFRFFLNSEIFGILQATEDSPLSSTCRKIEEDLYEITFESDYIEKEELKIQGEMIYNSKDKAITYLQIKTQQANTYTEKKIDNTLYKTYTTDTELKYTFIKNKGKYIPSSIEMNSKGFNTRENTTKNIPITSNQIIYFSTFNKGKHKGLKNKIDLSKKITDNIPDKEKNNSFILLSEQEKEFTEIK